MSADFTPEKEDYKILTPFKMQVLINFPYIEADFDALSNYQLLCKIVEYLNEVINNENEVTEQITSLYNAYVSLQNYVNDYFDNLDVEDEINAKLDKMAESGQLTDIIAQYLGLAGMLTFNNVAEMKLAENLVNGSKCTTLGFHSVNDGGNALYKIRTITNDDIVDEMTIIALYDNNLIAELIKDTNLSIKQLGAYGDGTHIDTQYIQKAVNISKKVLLNSGTFLVDDTITLPNGITLKGEGITNTTIKCSINNGDPIFKNEDSISHFNISDFYIDGQDKNAIGFYIANPYDSCVFKNLDIRLLDNTSIKCGNSSTISQSLLIDNCIIYGSHGNNNNPMIYLEKCYETNLTNSKMLFLSTDLGNAPCLLNKNTYDFRGVGNSFAGTHDYGVIFEGEALYCRLIGNTYELIDNTNGMVYFNGTKSDDGQYNIIIETRYYNVYGIINQNNCVGNIIIGPKSNGGRRNLAINTNVLSSDAYGNNYLSNDGKTLYSKGYGYTDYQDNMRFRCWCEDSQYADNGLKIKDSKTNKSIMFKPKGFDTEYNGYRIALFSPDGQTKKYIGIDNSGQLTLYDSFV